MVDKDDAGLLARMRFSGQWREYQQRTLDEFDAHLADRRLHVVAAPGSGKTILGLELVRRLGKPALVLAPTRIVRDQWSSRLVPLFLATPPHPAEISSDLATPAALTTTTYQALHALWTDMDSGRFAGLVSTLQALRSVTLVLDEAHHLRREWWNALQTLVDALPEARIVALTATPPYDAPYAEWSKYEAICGPIDLEIGVPELVRNKDLCPHQDHIVFSAPGRDALDLLDRRRQGVAALHAQLKTDAALLAFFEAHPWLTDSNTHAEAILEAPEVLSAILVHLAASDRRLPTPPLALLGIDGKDVPPMAEFWLETLLNALLLRFPDIFPIGEERGKALRATLHEYGLIEGGEVRLGETRSTFTLMAGSLAKLNSITAIARAESDSLGAALRMVVLSDHVRLGELPRAPTPDYLPAKLGVVPIFETLRRADIDDQKLGVLTGSIVILPTAAAEQMSAMGRAHGLSDDDLISAAMPACPGYASITVSEAATRRTVELVTALFTAGHVTILIGTQALLGEGWDAPAINSLVLASNAAAFMLSNQMRGRAIRIDPAHPDKVSNIWHLATVAHLPDDLAEYAADRVRWGRLDDGRAITSDLALLDRRFKAFEGIGNAGADAIEAGLERLRLPFSDGPAACNLQTFAWAKDRDATRQRWEQSIGDASERAHVREIASPTYAPRQLSWQDTVQWLAVTAVSGGVFAAGAELRHASSYPHLGALGMALAGAAALVTLPRLAKAAWLYSRNGSLEGSLMQVGRAVMTSLTEIGAVSDPGAQDHVFEVRRQASGRMDMIVHGLSRAEERSFMEALAEVLGPVQNPRYLLERRSWLGRFARTDYHAVPSLIARNKERAELFHRAWKAHVGSSHLVFTRTPHGRIALLRARARSFAAGFQRRVERRSAWL